MGLAHIHSLTEQRHALSDALSIRAGAIPVNSPLLHPEASSLVGENILKTLAITCATGYSGNGGALAFGMNSDAFKNVLTNVLRIVTVRRLTAHASHRSLCRMVEVTDFKDREFPAVDVDFDIQEHPELAEIQYDFTLFGHSGPKAALRTFGRNAAITRENIVNDDIEMVSSVFSNGGAACARLEAKYVYSLIESNPTLADGELMFHLDHGNIESAALDSSSLESAMGKLRMMETPAGNLADLPMAYLVVASGLELRARKLIYESGMSLSVSVVAAPWLASGRWYVMASPELSPVVALMHLKGSKGAPLIGEVGDDGFRDAITYGIRFDFGIVPIGRVGIVRGGL